MPVFLRRQSQTAEIQRVMRELGISEQQAIRHLDQLKALRNSLAAKREREAAACLKAWKATVAATPALVSQYEELHGIVALEPLASHRTAIERAKRMSDVFEEYLVEQIAARTRASSQIWASMLRNNGDPRGELAPAYQGKYREDFR